MNPYILYSCLWTSLFGVVNLIELNWPAMRPGGWKCSGVLYARRWVMRQTRTLLSGIPEICEISVERHVYNVFRQPAWRVFASWFKCDFLGKILLSERWKIYALPEIESSENPNWYIEARQLPIRHHVFCTVYRSTSERMFCLNSANIIFIVIFSCIARCT